MVATLSTARTSVSAAAPTLSPALYCFGAAATIVLGWIDLGLLLPIGGVWAMVLVLRHPADRIAFSLPFVVGWLLIDHGLYAGSDYLPQLRPYVGVTTPWELLSSGNVWAPRYLASYPAVWAADVTGVDLEVTWRFHLLTSMTLVGTVVHQLWIRIQAPNVPRSAVRLAFGISVVLVMQVIGTLMNGRLAAAYLGMAMILLGLVRWEQRGRIGPIEAVLIAVGVFPLSLMTSGTVLPAVGVIILAAWRALRDHGLSRFRTLVALAFLPAPAVPFIYFGILKNLAYFESTDEGLWGILMHGAGIIVTLGPLAVVTVLAAGVLGGAIFLLILRHVRIHLPAAPIVFWAVPISAVAGLAGYSTGSMALPAVAVLVMLAMSPGLRRLEVARARTRVAPKLLATARGR